MTTLLSIPDAARYLHIARSTLYLRIREGRIRVLRVSPGRVVIEERELEAYKRIAAGWCFFSSMTTDQKWEYGLSRLSGYTLVSDAESLDAAWKAAEAALPEGWWLRVTQGGDSAQAVAFDIGARSYGERSESGPTPAEALRNLAAALTPESSNAK